VSRRISDFLRRWFKSNRHNQKRLFRSTSEHPATIRIDEDEAIETHFSRHCQEDVP
jgi:hypothetical protein